MQQRNTRKILVFIYLSSAASKVSAPSTSEQAIYRLLRCCYNRHVPLPCAAATALTSVRCRHRLLSDSNLYQVLNRYLFQWNLPLQASKYGFANTGKLSFPNAGRRQCLRIASTPAKSRSAPTTPILYSWIF